MSLLSRRWVRWGGAAVVVLAVGGWWLSGAVGDAGGPTTRVAREDLVLGVELTGTLQAVDSSSLTPPQLAEVWDFKISFMAPEGEEITEGTPVLGFDTADLEQRLQRQQAEAEEAQKRIEKTEKDLDVQHRQNQMRLAEADGKLGKARLKVDVPETFASAQELDVARLDVRLAEYEVEYLKAGLESAERAADAQLAALRDQRDRAARLVVEIQQAIEQMTRKSPRDGTVIYTEGWRGDKKKVGDSCWKGEKVMEIPDLKEMRGDGQVEEADAGKLSEGQRVTLRLDAHPDVEFKGTIDSIWKTVQRKTWRSPLKVARLDIELDETDTRKMRPGMRFRGKVETERVAEALVVPREAVFTTNEGPVVYRRSVLGFEAIPVELGRRSATKVQVLDGLSEGDTVSLIDRSGAGGPA